MTRPQKIFIVLMVLLLTAVVHLIRCDYQYKTHKPMPLLGHYFEYQLHKKEAHAERTLRQLKLLHISDNLGAFDFDHANADEIAYYVFSDSNKLLFWSSNQLDVLSMPTNVENNTFVNLTNAQCMVKTLLDSNMLYVALIKIKTRYSVNNSVITNGFAKKFRMNPDVEIDQYAFDNGTTIHANNGNYLFSLIPTSKSNNSFWIMCSTIWWWIAIGLYALSIILIGDIQPVRRYWYHVVVQCFYCYVVPLAAIYIFLPSGVQASWLFVKELTYGNLFIPTLGHFLSISVLCTAYFATILRSNVYTWLAMGSSRRIHLLFMMVNLLYATILLIVGICYSNMVFMQNNTNVLAQYMSALMLTPGIILAFVPFTLLVCIRDRYIWTIHHKVTWWVTVVSDLLLATVFIVIYYLTSGESSNYHLISAFYLSAAVVCSDLFAYRRQKLPKVYYLLCLALIYAGFFAVFNHVWHTKKQHIQMESIAHSIAERADEVLPKILTSGVLTDLDSNISKDVYIAAFVNDSNNLSQPLRLIRYISNSYLDDELNDDFNMRLTVLPQSERVGNALMHQWENGELQHLTAHFYGYTNRDMVNHIVGFFDFKRFNILSNVLLVITFEQKNQMVHYGYPNAIFENRMDNKNNYSIAKYEHGRCVQTSGSYNYPVQMDTVFLNTHQTYYAKDYQHHIYHYDHGICVIVGTEHLPQLRFFELNFIIYFVLCFACYLIVYLIGRVRHQTLFAKPSILSQTKNSLISFTFFGLLTLHLTGMVVFYNEYRLLQRKNQYTQAQYVLRFFKPYLSEEAMQSPNFETKLNTLVERYAQEYKSDVHIFGSNGALLATSRNYIFSKGLNTRLISAKQFFAPSKDLPVEEEQLGRLRYLSTYQRIYSENGAILAYIVIPTFFSTSEMLNENMRYQATSLPICLVLILGIVLLSTWLSRRIARPLQTIDERMKSLQLQGVNQKIDYKYTENDEFGKLVARYNSMVDELKRSADLLANAEREKAWRVMAQQIAHEIKNPLTPMKMSLQQLIRLKQHDDSANFDAYFDKTAQLLIAQIDNLSHIASEFSNFARIPIGHIQRVDIMEIVNAIIMLYTANNEQIKLSWHSTVKHAYVKANKEQLMQVFHNLIKNAIQAIPEERAGYVDISVETAAEHVIVHVEDNGTGIRDDIKSHVFSPYFTTKSTGTGLGLGIVRNIVANMNGTITFTTQADKGTIFTITLPIDT